MLGGAVRSTIRRFFRPSVLFAGFIGLVFLSGCAELLAPPSYDLALASDNKADSHTAAQAPAPENPNALKKKILVLRFVNHSSVPADTLLEKLERDTKDKLLALGDVNFVPQSDLPESPQFYSGLGDYQISKIYAAARAHGIQGIVSGSFEDLALQETGEDTGLFRTRAYTVSATVSLQVHDVALEKVIYTKSNSDSLTEERTELFDERGVASESERGKEAASKALAKLLTTLPEPISRIAWIGRIARIELRRFYITGGEATGIHRGTLLRVFSESEPIVDPQTGKTLGTPPGRFKGFLKVVENFGSDASVAVIHSGAGFKEADRVEADTSRFESESAYSK